jgi:hypothetical protein
MDSSQTNQNTEDSKKFLKNIGNKLADEEEGNVKAGSINKEFEGLKKTTDTIDTK